MACYDWVGWESIWESMLGGTWQSLADGYFLQPGHNVRRRKEWIYGQTFCGAHCVWTGGGTCVRAATRGTGQPAAFLLLCSGRCWEPAVTPPSGGLGTQLIDTVLAGEGLILLGGEMTGNFILLKIRMRNRGILGHG